MAKAPKKKAEPVTAEQIERAAKTSFVQDLVEAGNAFARAGVHGPFRTELPLLTSVMITGKSYRRIPVPINSSFNADNIRLGKREGLIFVFKCEGEMKNSHGPAEWMECGWDDVINVFGDLADRIERNLTSSQAARKTITEIDAAVRESIKKNPSMHKVLSEGMVAAQAHARKDAISEQLESLPGFGSF